MQEDKSLKMLLHEYAIEETSSTFNNNLMQKIISASFTQQSKPLLNTFILNLLKIIFSLAIATVIICIIFMPFKNFPEIFSVNLSYNTYQQLFSFVIVFWIVMFINIWWNKKRMFKNYAF